MANVVLFHHVLGLTDGVHAFADQLRDAGHQVVTADLFGGRRFATIEEGAAHLESIGVSALIERGQHALEGLESELVFVGISMGVICAQYLAQTHPDAKGAVLIEACLPVTEFGEAWPAGVSVEIHGMSHDPFFAGEGDIDNARAIVASATASARLFAYPGDRHLFVDSSLPTHDVAAAALVLERTLAFLDRADRDGA